MKHIHRSVLLLICLTFSFASFVGAQEKQNENLPVVQSNSDTTILNERIGVRDIVVDKSNLDDVIKTFGKGYSLIKHGAYSDEVYFKKECLSFRYMQSNKDKLIYNISATLPCKKTVATSKGIFLGSSNFQEVFRIYGEPPDEVLTTTETKTWFYEYPGITFNANFVSWEEAKELETFEKKIISEIEIESVKIAKPYSDEDDEDKEELP